MKEITSSNIEPFPLRVIPEIIFSTTRKKLTNVTPIATGVMNYKYLCITNDGSRYILRVYPKDREYVLAQETQILNRCRKIGLSVPNVLNSSIHGPSIGLAYLIYPEIEGEMLSTYLNSKKEVRLEHTCEKLCEIFSCLSSLKIKNYGELISGDEAQTSSWNLFVSTSIHDGRNALYQSNIAPIKELELIEKEIMRILTTEGNNEGALMWGDASQHNIIVNAQGNITGLIDFESCLSGPNDCTTGYLINTLSPFKKNELLMAKSLIRNSNQSHDLLFSYSLLRAYRIAKYLQHPLPTGKKRDELLDIFPGLHLALQYFEIAYKTEGI